MMKEKGQRKSSGEEAITDLQRRGGPMEGMVWGVTKNEKVAEPKGGRDGKKN